MERIQRAAEVIKRNTTPELAELAGAIAEAAFEWPADESGQQRDTAAEVHAAISAFSKAMSAADY